MEDFNSKYTGEQVEALLDIVSQGGSSGGTITEAEIAAMGFTKNQGTITEVKMNGVSKGTSGVVDLGNVITEHQDISGKVDKVTGKGLSTEDFTTALKSKLEGLSNYDDTTLSNALATLRSDFDKLVSGDSTTAIKTFNEIIAFLDGIADTEDLASIIASIGQQIAGKQATITDLATIREGAAKGATAVQPKDVAGIVTDEGFVTADDLAGVAKTGSYNDLMDKPTIPSAVTESTVSGWGFTKNTGTYSKPSGGIPKSDFASDVQTSLSKADTAVQRDKFDEIEYIQIQGFSGPLSGVLYALPSEANGDEDDVIATRETLKTINGESLLGEGDITTPTFLRIGDADNEAKANFIAVANGEKSADYYICSSGVQGASVDGIVTNIEKTGPSASPISASYTFYGSPMAGAFANKLLKITTTLTVSTGAITTTYEAVLDAKQDAITDLEDIREGAAKGATAVQLYITDFDVLSLYNLARNPDGRIQSDNREITEALAANKIVLVPYAIGDEFTRGYATLVGYTEDLLYFKVIADSGEFVVETQFDAFDIYGREVTLREWSNKQDLLVSGKNIKTINGESILGSGDIEISGGSSVEDNRYFTNFTVEAVINAAPGGIIISYNNVDALIEAVRANKLICIPYADVDSGYVVASYSFTDGGEFGLEANFNILESGSLYYFHINYIGDSYAVRGNGVVTLSTYVGEIAVEDGVAYVPAVDNSVYIIQDIVEELYVWPDGDLNIGITIKFISGENLTIELPDCFWANGVVPNIEPNTHYELSISHNLDYGINAVLTPFKTA